MGRSSAELMEKVGRSNTGDSTISQRLRGFRKHKLKDPKEKKKGTVTGLPPNFLHFSRCLQVQPNLYLSLNLFSPRQSCSTLTKINSNSLHVSFHLYGTLPPVHSMCLYTAEVPKQLMAIYQLFGPSLPHFLVLVAFKIHLKPHYDKQFFV
jgi:hypothetical protein